MGGGGSQNTTTKPVLPRELRELFGTTADQISGVFEGRDLSDVFGVGPRGVAGANDLQLGAAENVAAFNDPTAAGNAAFDAADKLTNPSAHQGVDISGLGTFQDFSNQADAALPARESFDSVQNPDQVASALNNMDFANHPALQSAMKSFEAAALPGLANQLGAAGLSRSGAAGSAIAGAKAQMAMPIMQQLMSGAVQERGQDIGQRSQDIQSGLTQRQQDISSGVGQRGQDIGAIGQKLNAALGARGQDVQALLGQGSQALEARGQDIQSIIGGMGGFQNINQQDLQRLQASIDASMGVGGTLRDIDQEGLNSIYDAATRDSDLLAQIGLAPLGGLTAGVGSTTSSSGGSK